MLAKKAQVSIEVLAILSILVVGAVLFGVYYLNSINKSIGTSSKLLEDGFSQIGADIYQNDDQDTNNELPTPEGVLSIVLSLSPPGASQINTDFNVDVNVTSIPDTYHYNNLRLKNIVIKSGAYETSNCSYNGSYDSQFTPNTAFSSENMYLSFDCKTPGTYKIYVTVGVENSTDSILNDIKDISKTITFPTNGFIAYITSPTEGLSSIDNILILSSKFDWISSLEDISCHWSAVDENGSAQFISSLCNDVITNPATYFNINEKYIINLQATSTNGYSSNDSKVVVFVNGDNYPFLLFDPVARTYVNNDFSIEYITKRQVNTLVGEQLSLNLPADCSYNSLNYSLKNYTISSADGTVLILYGYKFNANCSMVGTKTITGEVRLTLGMGGSPLQIIESATDTYKIIPISGNPSIDFNVVLGFTGNDLNEPDEIVYNLKDKDNDTLYFAGGTTPVEYIDYNINQNQEFRVVPKINNDPNNTITQCRTTITKIDGVLSAPIDYGTTSCSIPQIATLTSQGTYRITVTGYTGAPNYNTYSRTKKMQVNALPFYIISSEPNNKILLSDQPINFEVSLSNINENPINVTLELFKNNNPGGGTIALSSVADDTLFFSGVDLEDNSFTPLSPIPLICNADFTSCIANRNLAVGAYIGKAIATSTQDSTKKFIKYSNFKIIDGLSLTAAITGLDTPYHGTENTYTALLYTTDGENQIFYPAVCDNWQINSDTVSAESGNCSYTIIPANLNTQTIQVNAKVFAEQTPGFFPQKYITVIENTKIVYPNSINGADTNTNDPEYGVHLIGSQIELSAKQAVNSAGRYESMLPAFMCHWRYKSQAVSNYTSLTPTDCNTSALIIDGDELATGNYDVRLEVKYDGYSLYTKNSVFKIRECAIPGQKCQFNGVCNENYKCSYLQFPGVSMDLAKNYVTSAGVVGGTNGYWKRAPYSGIGHNLITPRTGVHIAKIQGNYNVAIADLMGDYSSSQSQNVYGECSSSVSVAPLVKGHFSDGNIATYRVYASKSAFLPDYLSNRMIKYWYEIPFDTPQGEHQYSADWIGEDLNIVESVFENTINETSPVTIIATGLAADNEIQVGDNYYPYQFKLTKLMYYSLNNNKYIRKFAIIDCDPVYNDLPSMVSENCGSPITFADIDSQLSGSKSLSTFTKDGQNYNYYYDYPQIERKDNKLAIVGARYAIDPNTSIHDFNIMSMETYILYTPDITVNNNWELYTMDDPQFSPMEPRGNTLLFDSEGKLHYSFISGASQLVNHDDYLRFYNTYGGGISQPMELVFNPATEELEIESIYPNPGLENSQLLYFFGENGGTYLAQPYGSTIVDRHVRPTEIFKDYSQQAINTDENWMVQIWVSHPIVENPHNSFNYVNGHMIKRILKASFSNDNGKHWTAPVDLISNIDNSAVEFSSGPNYEYFGYPIISREIVKVSEGVGRFGIVISDYDNLNLDDYDNPSDQLDEIPQHVYNFDVNFGQLIQTTGVNEYEQYLMKNASGNLVNSKAGSINYDTYRKPYIISKISNDQNFYDIDYINSNCVLFGQISYYSVNKTNLTNKQCVLQLEQFYQPQLLNVVNGQNDDDYGCGSTSSGGGGPDAGNLCFKEGTKVYTPQGYKNIENIKSGDKVYSLDEETKELIITTVKTPLIHKTQNEPLIPRLYKINLSNGIQLFVTENHSFYISNIKDYKQLINITLKDDLLYYNPKTNNFEEVRIVSKELQEKEETYYNLSLIENHNYLAEGIVVHNDWKHLPYIFMPPVSCIDGCSYFTWFDMQVIIENLSYSSNIYQNMSVSDVTVYESMSAYFNPAIPLGGGNFWLSVDWPDGTSGYGFYSSTGGFVSGYNLGNLGPPPGGTIYCPTC